MQVAPDPHAPEKCRDNDRVACIAAAQGRASVEAIGYLAKACDLGSKDYLAEQGWKLGWDASTKYWLGCSLLSPLVQPAVDVERVKLGPGWHDVTVPVAITSPVLCGEQPIGPFGGGGADITISFAACGPELAR